MASPAAASRSPTAELIGRARSALPTPALVLDLAAAQRNIAAMAEQIAGLPVALRPHIKVHKCPALARMQIDAGAIGVATATAWEAVVMAQSGIEDVLVANQVVGADKVRALAHVARDHRITVAVDDARNVDALAEASRAAGAQIEVLIELDVGMGRCGVRSPELALRLAEHVAGRPELRLRGVQGYEGHCMLEPDLERRRALAHKAMDDLVACVDRLAEAGFPSESVSGGGTGTYLITGANPRLTELQAGTYCLMDAFHDELVPGGFAVAATVMGTVISRQDSTVVLDCGRKAVGVDYTMPRLLDHPEAVTRAVAEEHMMFDFASAPPLDLGDVVAVVAGYGPTTVNLHDAFYVVDQDDVVVDVWPIVPRGPSPLFPLIA